MPRKSTDGQLGRKKGRDEELKWALLFTTLTSESLIFKASHVVTLLKMVGS